MTYGLDVDGPWESKFAYFPRKLGLIGPWIFWTRYRRKWRKINATGWYMYGYGARIYRGRNRYAGGYS